VLAEESMRGLGEGYIWRPGMPFNERGEPRNFLWRIQHYSKVYDGVNSLSHLEDFVRASLDLWEKRAPFGIYNLTNPGAVSTRQIIGMIERLLKPNRRFEFWKDDDEFYHYGAKSPRSNCILEVSKLLSTGVKMRPVEEALESSLCNWNQAATVADLVHR
jgi:nucleoside-diphosphate-sugar epimerase